jgi:FKBP-type peptidyl-prolyl cis-trans isomerase FkpA
MKFSKGLIVVAIAVFAVACSQEKETPKGYKYTLARKGDGNIAKPGQYLKLDLVFKDAKDSVWNDTRKGEFPLIIPVRDTTGMSREEGLEEVFRVLSKGDSIVMKINAQTLFEKSYRQPMPPKVDPKSDFTFLLSVQDVLDSAQVRKLSDELMAKQQEKMRLQEAEQLGKDTVIIDNYLKEKKIVAQKTKSGLRYAITKPGTGKMVQPGQQVSIHYAGYLLNGKCFDTSIASVAKAQNVYTEGRPYEPIQIAAGQGQVIRGWDEAMLLMNKGSKMTVYIPSTLAYGPNKRSADIIENSILIFDMELVK